jgi:hypothetical protein
VPVIPAFRKMRQEDTEFKSTWLHSRTMSQKQTNINNYICICTLIYLSMCMCFTFIILCSLISTVNVDINIKITSSTYLDILLVE